jgi:hypothetical protein
MVQQASRQSQRRGHGYPGADARRPWFFNDVDWHACDSADGSDLWGYDACGLGGGVGVAMGSAGSVGVWLGYPLSMKPASYTWELGQTVGYIGPIAAPEGHARRRFADHRGNYILAVTNDSVNWAYRIVPAYTDERREGSSVYMSSVNPRALAAEGAAVRGLPYAVTRLQSNLRLPIEWAKRLALT